MDRGHLKESFSAGLLKVGDLDHNREYLHQIDQSDNQDDPRHLQHIGCTCHKSSKCQRSGISHKYLCRIDVK